MGNLLVLSAHSWETGFESRLKSALEKITAMGMRVISCNEFLLHIREKKEFSPGTVLLTFDDGALQDEIAFRILKQFRLPSIFFVIPSPNVPYKYYRQPQNLEMWKQFRASTMVSIESHTMTHAKVFINDRVTSIVSRALERQNIEDFDYRAGAPIFESAPGLTHRKYFPDKSMIDRCVDKWHEIINRGMTTQQAAEILFEDLRELQKESYSVGFYETEQQMMDRLHNEIVGSKLFLEEKLDKQVKLFAYPFGSYSDLSRNQIEKAGYLAAFTTEEKTYSIAQDPLLIGRIPINRFIG
jgi:peptidoglycan/xylan/chitin deacetylase (PgdA/CDA1 family)